MFELGALLAVANPVSLPPNAALLKRAVVDKTYDACRAGEQDLLLGQRKKALDMSAYVPHMFYIAALVWRRKKGVSSRMLLKERPDLRPWTNKGLWSPNYFAASCGGAPIEAVRQYIENQASPRS